MFETKEFLPTAELVSMFPAPKPMNLSPFMFPITSNFSVGVVIPNPILPRPVIVRLNPDWSMLVAWIRVPPSCTLPVIAVKPLLAVACSTLISRGVDDILLIVEVRLVPEKERELELIKGVVPETTPLTVEVKRLPLVATKFELIKGTEPSETPFTFPVRLF